jgi:hypothetical protein
MAVSPGQCQPAAAQDNHRAARDNRARVRRVVNWHDLTVAFGFIALTVLGGALLTVERTIRQRRAPPDIAGRINSTTPPW